MRMRTGYQTFTLLLGAAILALLLVTVLTVFSGNIDVLSSIGLSSATKTAELGPGESVTVEWTSAPPGSANAGDMVTVGVEGVAQVDALQDATISVQYWNNTGGAQRWETTSEEECSSSGCSIEAAVTLDNADADINRDLKVRLRGAVTVGDRSWTTDIRAVDIAASSLYCSQIDGRLFASGTVGTTDCEQIIGSGYRTVTGIKHNLQGTTAFCCTREPVVPSGSGGGGDAPEGTDAPEGDDEPQGTETPPSSGGPSLQPTAFSGCEVGC